MTINNDESARCDFCNRYAVICIAGHVVCEKCEGKLRKPPLPKSTTKEQEYKEGE